MNIHISTRIKSVNLRSYVQTVKFLSLSCKHSQQSESPKGEEQSNAICEIDQQDDMGVRSVDAIRDKSGLSKYLKSVMKGENPDLKFRYQFQIQNLRRHYGKHGQRSQLNPGLCYPTPEELAYKKEYEILAYPPLPVVLEKVKNKQEAEATYKKERLEQIESKIKLLPKLRKEMLERQARKDMEAKARLDKKDKVVAEIREILGFNVDVKDPKFQEMLEKRDLEERKQKKLVKKEKLKVKALQDLIDSSTDALKEPKEDLDKDEDDDPKPKKKLK